MSIISSRIVRSKVVINAPFGSTSLVDVRTSQSIESVRGNATTFQFSFFTQPDDVICDLSSVESLNLKIQPQQTPSGVTLADKSIAAGDLDLTTTAMSWASGAKCQAEFHLSNAEMNLNPEGSKKVLWLVITAILTDGNEVTLAGGNFILHEDNNATAGSPPVNPGAGITLEQADARYANGLSLSAPPVNGVAEVKQIISMPDGSGYYIGSTGTIILHIGAGYALPDNYVNIDINFTEMENLNIFHIYDKLSVNEQLLEYFSLAITDDEEAIEFTVLGDGGPSYSSLAMTWYAGTITDFNLPNGAAGPNRVPGVTGTAATRVGQVAVVNLSSIYMCARVNPAKWLGPIFPHPEAP
jgi:hypothetical protein